MPVYTTYPHRKLSAVVTNRPSQDDVWPLCGPYDSAKRRRSGNVLIEPSPQQFAATDADEF
ncbi:MULTISPECIES: hypothetical protein [Crateriforma]|nr:MULTISPECIES: hypothetical protein [Crateriforma]